MTDRARPNRQNIYLPDHLRDAVAGYESLSGRIARILDRYHEALRRTRIERRFSDEELHAIESACWSWFVEPAAVIFDGVAIEVEDYGDEVEIPSGLVDKVRQLTPFEQVALVEWVERKRGEHKAKVDS